MVKRTIIKVMVLLGALLCSAPVFASSIPAISAHYLNQPYKPEVFDCQIYVETVLAQYLNINVDNIAYDKGRRNHFPSTQWIPNNIQKGYIHYLPIDSHIISKKINEINWCIKKYGDKKNCTQDFQNITASIKYIPITLLPKKINQIPNGSIIFIVDPKKYTLISHMGFAIWKNNILYLRAASSLAGRVVDFELLRYLHFEHVWGISVLAPKAI